jgi:hypothetical protein
MDVATITYRAASALLADLAFIGALLTAPHWHQAKRLADQPFVILSPQAKNPRAKRLPHIRMVSDEESASPGDSSPAGSE